MPQKELLEASELLDFVNRRMRMTGYYQPVVIAELVKADRLALGRDELATKVLLADPSTLERAVRVLMRWPKQTLERHGITSYDKSTKRFHLLADLPKEADRQAVLDACARRLEAWTLKEAPQMASARFAAIEAAGGRCQACGVVGSVRPLDIDHVVPYSTAKRGHVIHPTLGRVPVHSVSNLQVLCSKCNRGKRDASTYDFRPSEERLVETIRLTLELADRYGFDRGRITQQAALGKG
jgi:5-methylcytosine-specific restriction endonuclease McrA